MNITNETSTGWLRRIASLTLALALAACSAGIEEPTTEESGTVSSALQKQQADDGSGEVTAEFYETPESSLKAGGGGLNFDCTTECGGGGGCCTCYGWIDCINMAGSGQCKSGTFGCGGDGCMCDWKVWR